MGTNAKHWLNTPIDPLNVLGSQSPPEWNASSWSIVGRTLRGSSHVKGRLLTGPTGMPCSSTCKGERSILFSSHDQLQHLYITEQTCQGMIHLTPRVIHRRTPECWARIGSTAFRTLELEREPRTFGCSNLYPVLITPTKVPRES